MMHDELNNRYFNWLFDLVCGNRYSTQISYKKLLMHLHNTEFRYSIPRDQNRAEDGMDLRYHFALSQGYEDPESSDVIIECLYGPCSVLEMMIALAKRCETDIMDDTNVGDRTTQWFWGMVTNLGLGSMVDKSFDKRYVDKVLQRFLDREYEPDGTGGLFRIRNCDRDLRTVEIWWQMCWYLDTIE